MSKFITTRRASPIFRVQYQRAGWKHPQTRLFGTADSAERFVEKLRAGKPELREIVKLKVESGVVAWNTEVDEDSTTPSEERAAVRAGALDRFLERYGREYGADPDDVYDLKAIEKEIRNGD